MTAIINSIYNFVAAIFSIPAACCNAIYSLFSSTVPQQVAQVKQGNSQPLTEPRVVDQTQSGQQPVVKNIVDAGLRRRNVPSAQTTSTTQPSAVIVQPQRSPALSNPTAQTNATNGSANRLPVNSSLPVAVSPKSQVEEEEMLRLAIANSMQNQAAVSTSTSSSTQPSNVMQPTLNAQNSTSSTNSTRRTSDTLATFQQRPVSSSHPVIPTNLTDDELMALAIANSMKPEENEYVPQVGNKGPIEEFIDRFQVQNNRREPNPQAIAIRERLTALRDIYPMYRPIRGDGNCFYTSFAVDLLSSFNSLSQEQKLRIVQLIRDCKVPEAAKFAVTEEEINLLAEAKIAVVSGLQRMVNGGLFDAKDQLMLQFVRCLRYIGADYMSIHHNQFMLDADGVLGDVVTMLSMGQNTDAGALIAVVMALRHPIRVIHYSGDKETNFAIGNYYDITVDGHDDCCFWAPTMMPVGPHPDRILLYSGGHYSLLHKA